MEPNGDYGDEHDDEIRELTAPCADCGAQLPGESDRAFGFGTDQLLCWQCAERRGGRYDARQERWSVAPDVADLQRRLGRES
jgi:hypothetical protein